MVNRMVTTKITITLPDGQLEEIRKRVAEQDSPTISGFIQQAVQKSLENAAEFRAMVKDSLDETGGPLKAKERAWARRMLSGRRRGAGSPKAALAQVIRNPPGQVRLWRMIQFEKTEVMSLDGWHAQAVAALLAQTGTSKITDAHVVICAQTAGYAVVTSDPLNLRRLSPKLRVVTV
jgi:hypothetical protein